MRKHKASKHQIHQSVRLDHNQSQYTFPGNTPDNRHHAIHNLCHLKFHHFAEYHFSAKAEVHTFSKFIF